MEGWKTVAKTTEKEPDLFKVPTSNTFTDLPDYSNGNKSVPEKKN